MKLKPWDIAAGLLIAQAGATTTDWQGQPVSLKLGEVLCAGPTLHRELLAVLRTVEHQSVFRLVSAGLGFRLPIPPSRSVFRSGLSGRFPARLCFRRTADVQSGIATLCLVLTFVQCAIV